MKLIFSFIVLVIAIAANAQDTTYKEIVGKYKFPSGSVIEEAVVAWENNVFTMSSAVGLSTLERVKGDTFNVVSFNGICVFKRDDAKKITGVHVEASGYVLDGTKETASLNEVSDAAEEEKLRIRQQVQVLLQYHTRKTNRPFEALVYN